MYDILEMAALAVPISAILLERVHRARPFPRTRLWRTRGLVATALALVLGTAVTALWAGIWGDVRLFDLSGLGTWGAAGVGILIYELGHYGYHRAAHEWSWLWRLCHQLHHSAESLDVFGAYYLSPLDLFMFTTVSATVFIPVLGLSLESAIIANLWLAATAVFQHMNVRTPRWLGYLVQRPESHGVHHQRGLHRYNYADLPVIDMIFGTFRNPARFDGEVGFYDGASLRVGEMLLGRDVSVPPAAEDAEREGEPEAPVLERAA